MLRMLDNAECQAIATDLICTLEAAIVQRLPDASEQEKALAMATVSAGVAVACNVVSASFTEKAAP